MTQKPQNSIALWSRDVPGALGVDPQRDIPTLTPYRPAPEKVTGAAMVVCPGGGYSDLASHEGRDYALWLCDQGITCFVLKYRLGSHGYRHPAMLHDVQRAIRWVRFHSAEWKINPEQIGVIGSSAGGHLASTGITHFDNGQKNAIDPIDCVSCRPDLGILCYPVISMGPLAHQGSRDNLLGPNPSPESVELLSSERQVIKDTPPCFIWHTLEDPVVDVQNSLEFANALLKNGIHFDLHVYERGAHGLGLGIKPYEAGMTDPAKLLPWTRDLIFWLKQRGFIR